MVVPWGRTWGLPQGRVFEGTDDGMISVDWIHLSRVPNTYRHLFLPVFINPHLQLLVSVLSFYVSHNGSLPSRYEGFPLSLYPLRGNGPKNLTKTTENRRTRDTDKIDVHYVGVVDLNSDRDVSRRPLVGTPRGRGGTSLTRSECRPRESRFVSEKGRRDLSDPSPPRVFDVGTEVSEETERGLSPSGSDRKDVGTSSLDVTEVV